MSPLPSLHERIYALVQQIPPGKVATYGQIARLAGGCSARMVGYAMAGLPSGSRVPWQRVINAKGRISPHGAGFGSAMQEQLLREEDILFDPTGKIDLERFGWSGLLASSLPDLPQSYSRVAPEYARRFFHELQDKPFDRSLLDRYAALVSPLGRACDLGCGPGEIGRYLKDVGGLDVLGIDIAPGMVEVARSLNPDLEFQVGDMRALPLPDACLGGIAAFYALIHVPPAHHAGVMAELRRVLVPGGWLLLAFHIGQEIRHIEEWWGESVALDFHFFLPENITRQLESAGFTHIEVIERPPYPEVEAQTRRAYILAQKPDD